jgi:molecular chaperone GrpE
MKQEEPDAIPQESTPAENEPEGRAPENTGAERKALDAAQREAESLKDQFLRKAAEFENYKRRMETELRSVIENASERLIVDLLPVLDDFDRLLKSSKEETSVDALRQGFELIANKLNKILALRGLRPFESTGKPFNVDFHDALLQTPRNDVPPHTVVEEVTRGYSLNDRVIRHAGVIVSTAGSDGTANVSGGDNGPMPPSTNTDA